MKQLALQSVLKKRTMGRIKGRRRSKVREEPGRKEVSGKIMKAVRTTTKVGKKGKIKRMEERTNKRGSKLERKEGREEGLAARRKEGWKKKQKEKMNELQKRGKKEEKKATSEREERKDKRNRTTGRVK